MCEVDPLTVFALGWACAILGILVGVQLRRYFMHRD
jgi:hypothetical protein